MADGECRNRLALPVYGARPSRGICAQCEHRNGMRGLGDALAWLLSFTPAARLQKRQCGGCKARQAALNEAVPAPNRTRKCGSCQKSANAG